MRSIADELRKESERLRKLAEDLAAREETLAEMIVNYPHMKRMVYDLLRKEFERELPVVPEGMTLEQYAAKEGALTLEEFIDELEPPAEGPEG